MSIKSEVLEYLKNRKTADTPKRIAHEIGRGTAGNIARALKELTAEGMILRGVTGVQNACVVYQWNKDWKPKPPVGKKIGCCTVYPKGVLPPAPQAPVQSELRKLCNKWLPLNGDSPELGLIENKLVDGIVTEIDRLSAKVKELSANPEPVDASGEYWVNVWLDTFYGEILPQHFKTKADAARDIKNTDKERWQLIGQHTGTYEVEA